MFQLLLAFSIVWYTLNPYVVFGRYCLVV
uniref:Uncharacterized protein n=1 Tax=Arundo donax TaxID=35708 RepID=A0A0A9FUN1_ARUDO